MSERCEACELSNAQTNGYRPRCVRHEEEAYRASVKANGGPRAWYAAMEARLAPWGMKPGTFTKNIPEGTGDQ